MISRSIICTVVALASAYCTKDPPATPEPADPVELTSKILVDNLLFPWEILWGPDDHIWMTERPGKISRVDPADGSVTEVITIDEVDSRGEGGLLGMVLHPQFDATPQVFVAYNYDKSGTYTEKIVRFNYSNGTLNDPVTIIDNIAAGTIHNGCRLVISSDQKLFITTGDASNQSLPQNIASPNGKVLRVNLDGSIPSDNPDAQSPVWSSGHRNPQGLVFVNDNLLSSEHGPDTDDEVNVITRNDNYGWPDVKGLCDASEQSFCDAHDVVEPIMKWTPTIAACGLDYYNNDLIPQWKNSLLMCTLKASRLMQLKLKSESLEVDSTNEFFTNDYGRLRDLCISPAGKVYLCTSNGSNDKIIEVGKK